METNDEPEQGTLKMIFIQYEGPNPAAVLEQAIETLLLQTLIGPTPGGDDE